MLRLVFASCGLLLSLTAHAQSDCQIPALPQSEKTPQVAALAKTLRATNPCKVLPGMNAKSLSTVWASLLSNKKLGGRRLDTEAPTSLPQGVVAGEKRQVHFDFSESAAEGLASLRIEVDGKPVLNISNPPPQFDFPVDRYTPDQTMSWTLVTRIAAYRAQFTLMAEPDRKDLEQKLAHLAAEPVDPVTRLVYKAAIYDEADLFSERDLTFLEIRRLVSL
ncbi:hypothetical protein [Actimicrobium antarcticum]|uniref:Uncharacterized protein n=1 Tax=Actimicrobium antarcticum TaxID=1051899 RepID=A0ABP7TUN6_9BURK